MQRVGPWLFRVAFWAGVLPFVVIAVACLSALLMKMGLIPAWSGDMPFEFGAAALLCMGLFFGSLAMASRIRCSACHQSAFVYRDSDGETVTQPWRFNCAHCGKAL